MNSQHVSSKSSLTKGQNDKGHPLMMIVNLLLLAASAFFIYLIVTIWAISEPFETPLSNTHVFGLFFLSLPTFFISSTQFQLKEEKVKPLVLVLALTAISLAAYISLQFLSLEAGVALSNNLSSKIYYMIAVSHACLAFVMAIMTCYLVAYFSRSISNPVISLIIFTNPFEKLRLTLFVRLLKFTQLSWIVSYLLLLALV